MKNATWALRAAKESLERAERGEMTPPAPTLIPVEDYQDMAAAETEALRELEEEARLRALRNPLSLEARNILDGNEVSMMSDPGRMAESRIAFYTTTQRQKRDVITNISLKEGLLEDYRRKRGDAEYQQLQPHSMQLLRPYNENTLHEIIEDGAIEDAKSQVAMQAAEREANKRFNEAMAEASNRGTHQKMQKWREATPEHLAVQKRYLVDKRLTERKGYDDSNHHQKSIEHRMRGIADQARALEEAKQRERERVAKLIAESQQRVVRESLEQQQTAVRGELESTQHSERMALEKRWELLIIQTKRR